MALSLTGALGTYHDVFHFHFLIKWFWGTLGLHGCEQTFSHYSEWGRLSSCGAWASHCWGFSCCSTQASVVVSHRPSCPAGCGIFPDQGSHPCLLLLLLLLSRFSRVRLCATPQTAAHQTPPSLGFSRQEHWSGLPFPSPAHESEKSKWSRSVMSDS